MVHYRGAHCTMSGIMYYYSNNVRPMTDLDKQTYNFLVVGLSLALGMNLASSLKEMAVDVSGGC